jgi:hypothetical protein
MSDQTPLIDWDALFVAYRNQTGRWPERVYLHPEDYRRTREHFAATLIAMPLTAVETAREGVPSTVTEQVPAGAPLLWPPHGLSGKQGLLAPEPLTK